MQQSFIRNLAFLLFLNILVKPFWILGVNVGVQNAVGPEGYGVYFTVLNLSYIFQIVLDIGIQNYNNRNVAQDPEFYRNHFANMALLKLILGVVYMVLLYGIGYGIMHYDAFYLYLLSIVGLNLFLNSFLLFLRSNLGGLHLFKWDSVASIADRVLMIAICGYLLWFQESQFQIEWFAWAQTASYVVTILFLWGVLLVQAGKIQLRFEVGVIKNIAQKSLPFALLGLIMSAYSRIDGVMLESMHAEGALEAGIYAQGYKLYEAATMISFLFSSLLLPMFSRQIAEKLDVRPLVKLASKTLMIPVFILVVASFTFQSTISEVMFTNQVDETAGVLGLLMIVLIPVSTLYIYGTLLTANGNLRLLNVTSLIGLIANVIINASLIPEYGAWGAAIATMVTQFAVMLLQFGKAWKIFEISISKQSILKLLIFMLISTGSAWVAHHLGYQTLISAVAYIISMILLAFIFRIIDIKEVFRLMKS